MRDWVERLLLALAIAAFALAGLAPPLHAQEDDRQESDCSQTSIGVTPLNDLGTGLYQGEQGGLYPDGSNEMPDAHYDLGLWAASQIVPRAASGAPDPDGLIGFISVGVSNTFREFDAFLEVVENEPALDEQIRFANGAQGGAANSVWVAPDADVWPYLDGVVAEAGLAPAQVQVAWLKMVARIDTENPAQTFPDDALTYREDVTTVLELLKQRFPNLAAAYLSSRIYSGYNTTTSPTPEPWGYQQGFGVKWTIESQIEGDPELSAAPGNAVAPWIAWGPYLWADGEIPRSDGLTWTCRDMRNDGVHPSAQGEAKVTALLMGFFRDEPTTAWMWTDRALEPPPPDIATASSTTSSTGATSTSTTTTTETRTSTSGPGSTTTTEPEASTEEIDSSLFWALGATLLAGMAIGAGIAMRRGRPGSSEQEGK
jgi:hypothetical protein